MTKILSVLGQLFVVALLAYILAFAFDYLPNNLKPESIMESSYRNIKATLSKDASSNSFTSGLSKHLNNAILDMEKSRKEKKNTEAKQAADKANEKPEYANPITKAKEATEQYEKQIKEQKDMLDKT